MTEEIRVPIERVNTATGQVTARGTALLRGACLDYYQSESGIPLELRPGEAWVLVTTMQVPAEDEETT